MQSSLFRLTLLLCLVVLTALTGGCSKEQAPVPVPAQLEPTPTQVKPAEPPTPTPTPSPVRVLLPGWLDKGQREMIYAKVSKSAPGRPVTFVQADDPAANKYWDVGLVAAGQAEMKTATLSAWILDHLHLYKNKAVLKQKGIEDPGTTWEAMIDVCTATPGGASETPVLILPGDLPGLPRSIQTLATLAGAGSTTKLDSKPLATAINLLFQLYQAGHFPVGVREGFSSQKCAELMAEAKSGLTLGWDTETGWITNPRRSPAASRIEVCPIPRFEMKGESPAPGRLSRLWCWQAKDPGLVAVAVELAHLDPGPEVGGKWVGGTTDTAALSVPGDLFNLDSRPGQDFRDTVRIVKDGWDHRNPPENILKSLEIRFTSALSK